MRNRRGGAARRRGVTRPQQAEAVPGKDAGAEMKAVGDALTVCATCDRLDERAAQLGLDGSTRAKREKQARYEERSGRYVQLLEQPMPQHLGELWAEPWTKGLTWRGGWWWMARRCYWWRRWLVGGGRTPRVLRRVHKHVHVRLVSCVYRYPSQPGAPARLHVLETGSRGVAGRRAMLAVGGDDDYRKLQPGLEALALGAAVSGRGYAFFYTPRCCSGLCARFWV